MALWRGGDYSAGGEAWNIITVSSTRGLEGSCGNGKGGGLKIGRRGYSERGHLNGEAGRHNHGGKNLLDVGRPEM